MDLILAMAAARVALLHATDARSQFPPFARLTCNRHAAGLSGSNARSTVLAHEDHGGTQGVSPLHPARHSVLASLQPRSTARPPPRSDTPAGGTPRWVVGV